MTGEGQPLAGGARGPRPGRPAIRPDGAPPFETRRDGTTRLGDRLRAERERRGFGLEEISESTKIRRTYLEALERHDWNALPADVFTRGYVRAFAQHLGLDPEQIMRVYARERRISAVGAPSESRDDGRQAARAVLEKLAKTRGAEESARSGSKARWLVAGVVAAGIAAAALSAFFWLRGPDRPRPSATATREVPASPAAATTPPAKPEPAAPVAATPPPVLAAEPPPPTETAGETPLRIVDSGVGTGVVERQLVGTSDRFEEGTVVWFWTSVVGGRPGDAIQHVWMHDGQTIGVAELEVSSPSWRTQSGRQLPPGLTGDWTVEARDLEGHVLARNEFTCVEASVADSEP